MGCAGLISCNKENAETSIHQEALLENLQGKSVDVSVTTLPSRKHLRMTANKHLRMTANKHLHVAVAIAHSFKSLVFN